MGKREKKAMEFIKGSRMIAYLPIPTRLLELKVFGKILELTKVKYNRFGVGSLGLHDLGQRLKEIWKGQAVSDDIAGFDTKISKLTLQLELEFLEILGTGPTARKLYEIYAHPMLLIPVPSEFMRSQLVEGQGQRMSGSNTTYSMNTCTRLAIALLLMVEVRNFPEFF